VIGEGVLLSCVSWLINSKQRRVYTDKADPKSPIFNRHPKVTWLGNYNGFLPPRILIVQHEQDLSDHQRASDKKMLICYPFFNINNVSLPFNKNVDQIIRTTIHAVTIDWLQQYGLVGSQPASRFG
jgi:hypothetical protein